MKKVFLAVGLSALVLAVWFYFNNSAESRFEKFARANGTAVVNGTVAMHPGSAREFHDIMVMSIKMLGIKDGIPFYLKTGDYHGTEFDIQWMHDPYIIIYTIRR